MKNKLPRIYLIAFVLLLLITLIFVSLAFWKYFFIKSSTPESKRAEMISKFTQKWQEKKPAKSEVSLSLSSKTNTFVINKDFEVEVLIDSQGKEIWGTDLRLHFDPTRLTVKQLRPGDYVPKPLILENRIDKEKGTVNFSLGTLKTAKGKGTLAVLQVQPIKEGETSLTFLPQTQVAINGKEEAAITEFHDFKFNVLKK